MRKELRAVRIFEKLLYENEGKYLFEGGKKMIKKVNKAIWILISMLLVFGLANVALAGQGSKNPPTPGEQLHGPAMVGTATIMYIEATGETSITLNVKEKGDEKTATDISTEYSADDVRNIAPEHVEGLRLSAGMAAQLGYYGTLQVNTVSKVTHQETGVGPMAVADIVILQIITK